MADTDGTEDWKIYWRINLLFYTSFLAKGKFRCMWCDKEEISTSLLRSDFALSAVTCSAGHVPNLDPDNMLGVCFDCDAELVQRITERRQQCFEKGCRRSALVQKANVVRRLGKTAIVERYLALVDKHRVFECEVCYCEQITPEQYSELQTTDKCQHDPVQCRDCLRADLEGRINAGEWRSIKCPHQSCDEELTPRDVDKFVSSEVFRA
ncbi:hypothetical protein CLCR_06285 [Cladophialophora carrionii]|uniref:Uncharacterized protein n=1 Tax=Cladophialophora carrionii TaxID=86049 RepID=A0A1C1C9U2_9EURO|nr:hypothetical protein CLCR_06285 [Cladophialophora carrionii]